MTTQVSARSARQHKAWGASPRIGAAISEGAREAGDTPQPLTAVARSAGLLAFPREILGLAPQALRSRPLRGLSEIRF